MADTTLILLCNHGNASSEDRTVLSWGPEPAGNSMLRAMAMNGSDVTTTNFHTIEQARELFNWLGVMLHTGGA